jgi:holin-like protein
MQKERLTPSRLGRSPGTEISLAATMREQKIPQLRRQKATDQADISVRRHTEAERVGVARMLPFCALPSWYNRYWLEESDSPRSVYLLRFKPRLSPLCRKSLAPSITNSEVGPPQITADRSRVIRKWLTPAALICLQLAGLWTLNFAGFWVVEKTRLPIPGNLVGMLTLFVLLVTGVVKIGWFELTGSFLIKHLAFFFVPITVGLMNAGPLLIAHGLGIILVLTISAAIGILLAGFVSQLLLAKP